MIPLANSLYHPVESESLFTTEHCCDKRALLLPMKVTFLHFKCTIICTVTGCHQCSASHDPQEMVRIFLLEDLPPECRSWWWQQWCHALCWVIGTQIFLKSAEYSRIGCSFLNCSSIVEYLHRFHLFKLL